MEITNASTLVGAYPKKLNLTRAVPIFKSGDDSDPNNYRPIIIPSLYVKRIFEKRMYKRLKSFFLRQMIFRMSHSTTLDRNTLHSVQ